MTCLHARRSPVQPSLGPLNYNLHASRPAAATLRQLGLQERVATQVNMIVRVLDRNGQIWAPEQRVEPACVTQQWQTVHWGLGGGTVTLSEQEDPHQYCP